MKWNHVTGYGLPTDDGDYLVAYRGERTKAWTVLVSTFENDRFDVDTSEPHVELWCEIPPFPR